MNVATLASIVAAAITSPLLVEMAKAWSNRHKTELEIDQANLNLFYPTWKEEMERLHTEIDQLRQLVLKLSDEVHRLGGDPRAIVYTINTRHPAVQKDDEPEE